MQFDVVAALFVILTVNARVQHVTVYRKPLFYNELEPEYGQEMH